MSEDEIIKRMTAAQFGNHIEFVQNYMEEYFKKWPEYKNKLTHLEWFHLFTNAMEAFEEKIKKDRGGRTIEKDMIACMQELQVKRQEYEECKKGTDIEENKIYFLGKQDAYGHAAKQVKNILIWHGIIKPTD